MESPQGTLNGIVWCTFLFDYPLSSSVFIYQIQRENVGMQKYISLRIDIEEEEDEVKGSFVENLPGLVKLFVINWIFFFMILNFSVIILSIHAES